MDRKAKHDKKLRQRAEVANSIDGGRSYVFLLFPFCGALFERKRMWFGRVVFKLQPTFQLEDVYRIVVLLAFFICFGFLYFLDAVFLLFFVSLPKKLYLYTLLLCYAASWPRAMES